MLNVDVKTLLPQREPFLFLDELLSADSDLITGQTSYGSDFPYYQDCHQQKIVPGAILIESLVQCGGAGLACLEIGKDTLWSLATLEQVRFRGTVGLNATVTMRVRNVKLSNRIVRQSGVSFYGEVAILQATWTCLPLRNINKTRLVPSL